MIHVIKDKLNETTIKKVKRSYRNFLNIIFSIEIFFFETYKHQPILYLLQMSLKINYLDKSKFSTKNVAVFAHPDAKITKFKEKFDEKINQKIVNFLKKNKNTKDNKIISLNQDFDQKLIIILLVKNNNELESEKLGAKFSVLQKVMKFMIFLLKDLIFFSLKNLI